jgi:hypothetical protein
MFSVLLGTIVIIAIIVFSKHICKKQHDFFIRNYYVFPKSFREKVKSTDLFRDLIWFINLVLFVFIIFLLGAIVAFKLFGSTDANHALLKTIYFWFGTGAVYSKLSVMLFATSALFIVSYSLSLFLGAYRKKNSMEGIKAILELRKMLEEDKYFEIYRDLHLEEYDFVESPSSKEEVTKQMELFHYLGVMESASTMVRKEIVDMDQFYKHFGCRIASIVKCEALKDYLHDNKESYTDLLWVIREMKKIEKDKFENTNTHKDKTSHHDSEMFTKGRNWMKKGGKYLFDDK